MFILIVVMIFTGQSFGLRSALPGGAVGAVIGGITAAVTSARARMSGSAKVHSEFCRLGPRLRGRGHPLDRRSEDHQDEIIKTSRRSASTSTARPCSCRTSVCSGRP